MKLYCGNCGLQLKLTRKALPKFGIIVDVVNYHECTETPIPFDLNGSDKFIPVEGMDKFVQSLNGLELSPVKIPSFDGPKNDPEGTAKRGFVGVGTDNLRDRRFDVETKSTAPNSIAEQIRQMSNSIPAHEVKEIEQGKKEDDSVEMGD